MLDNKERFIIENYGTKSTFASFLPGISGKYGIPIWCHYVNRGQCVTSFGIEDKDHGIMEFFPAHQAYQNVKKQGFRTFLKIDGTYYEPFQDEAIYNKMKIGMNELEITEINSQTNMEVTAQYYTLPNERVGALVRKLTIKNIGNTGHSLELMDGMPAVVPYGVDTGSMKNMGQTCKAWMQVEDVEAKVPFFRVRVSMGDTADVTEVLGGNFYITLLSDGEKLSPIVDPEVVFHFDTNLDHAEGFRKKDVEKLLLEEQVKQNNLPCCFFGKKQFLKAKDSITLYEIIGQVENKEVLNQFVLTIKDATYFEEKYKEAVSLTKDLCKAIDTKTGLETFDSYCKQTYLDNLLRGGYPIELSKDKIFYLYSRKHGDIERDYNYFRMLPEFYSQGNGNYRDVNQNRRCDVMFHPYVKDTNMKTFYNLIQIDGYNPLSVEKVTYMIKEQNKKRIVSLVGEKNQERFQEFLHSPFTPGRLMMEVQDYEINCDSLDEFLSKVIDGSEGEVNGEFGEGYWSDHWTYNLDLVESYLSIYPDKEEEALFNDNTYTYFESKVKINDRKNRYVKTEHGIRQYKFLDKKVKNNVVHKQVRTKYGKGEVATSNLMGKLLLLSTIKLATLDPYGMGIEMEGGKPGWYDALNGLPGLFGSSMAETYELCRMIAFSIEKLEKYQQSVIVFTELAELMEEVYRITKEKENSLSKDQEVIDFWNEINDVKEAYREKTLWGVSGEKIALSNSYLLTMLKHWYGIVMAGITKAISYGDGICPTYFTYEVVNYIEDDEKIIPLEFKVHSMPLFLEGPVHYLKLVQEYENKKELYDKVKKSDLFDRKLAMYKVNGSLKDSSYEIGRTKAFTPGWLENESIWLHMEYKYLLELLKAGMYEEFSEDLKNACIPFLDVDTYGRSILENSSFLASSVNPNKKIHGKGFVARLSGSTAEFIHMWQIMMFGKQPFTIEKDSLRIKFEPMIPKYLVGSDKTIKGTFLGRTSVIYNMSEEEALVPEKYNIRSMKLEYFNGVVKVIEGDILYDTIAMEVRDGLVETIEVEIKNGRD